MSSEHDLDYSDQQADEQNARAAFLAGDAYPAEPMRCTECGVLSHEDAQCIDCRNEAFNERRYARANAGWGAR